MQVNCAPVRKKIIYNIPADADDSVNPLPPAIPTVRQGFSLLGCIRLTLMILSTHSPCHPDSSPGFLSPRLQPCRAPHFLSLEARLLPGERVSFLGFQTVTNGRGGNGRGDDAKTGWLLSLLPYRFSEI